MEFHAEIEKTDKKEGWGGAREGAGRKVLNASLSVPFTALGREVRLTPKMSRPPKFDYSSIYGSLIGTKYADKCPDMLVDDLWYEHEGFITSNAKRAFSNMMNHGLKQSARLVIDRPNLTERYMRRNVNGRIERGEDIQELWIREADGSLTLFYKKTDG